MTKEMSYHTIQEFKALHCEKHTLLPGQNSTEGTRLTRLCKEQKIPVLKKLLEPISQKDRKPETGNLHDLRAMNLYHEDVLRRFYKGILKKGDE